VAVVPPFWTGLILLLAPLAWRGANPVLTLAFEVIRSIAGQRFFALATEQLTLEFSVLTAKILNLGFEVLGAVHGPRVLSSPIPDLLPNFGVLTPQLVDFLPQLGDFATKLPYQSRQISRLGGRKWVDKRVFHDDMAFTRNLSCNHRAVDPTKRVGQRFTVAV
jgi:hypothetical protein